MKALTDSVKTESFEMKYIRCGSGRRTMVVFPGIGLKRLTSDPVSVANAFSAFAEEFSITVFDRIEELRPGYTVKDMARDSAEAMRMLGLTDACVYGVSQGGQIAQCIAIEHPGLVSRLALASTTSRETAFSKECMETWKRIAREGSLDEVLDAFLGRVYTPSFYARCRKLFRVFFEHLSREDLERFLLQARASENFDVTEQLSAIRCPVLVLAASEDRVFEPDCSRLIAEKTAADLCIYEGYGHAVYDELPELKKRLYAFFAS